MFARNYDDLPAARAYRKIRIQQMSLRCENLSKSFDGTHALHNLTLEFPASGLIAIIGPNGAGKTTLINVLTGFLKPNAGRFFLNKLELPSSPHKIARLGIARTFQDLRLISQVSVLENMMLARPNQKGEYFFAALFRRGVSDEEKQNHKEAMRWLEFVGLADSADQIVEELSYGQQKLLTIACCLATGSKILLLDEPVSGIHPEMVTKIANLLIELRKDGKLIIFIEHDIATVQQIADLVIVMDEGKIIAKGEPTEVLQRHELIEAFIK
jgi:branched-chain amino acid transport system ATP-binding protein